jgi:DNA polymerase (family X)
MSVPGIGRVQAERLHHDLGIGTLEDLEAAAHDGRLAEVAGFGRKRIAGVIDSLAGRLGRLRETFRASSASEKDVSVGELLDVDQEYRQRAAAGKLHNITPKRFNPSGEAWLPVLHTDRGDRHYTAFFSNTARAHQLQKTKDWVILYYDGHAREHQSTVITSRQGALTGKRIVRGRETECEEYYRSRGLPSVRAGTSTIGPSIPI